MLEPEVGELSGLTYVARINLARLLVLPTYGVPILPTIRFCQTVNPIIVRPRYFSPLLAGKELRPACNFHLLASNVDAA